MMCMSQSTNRSPSFIDVLLELTRSVRFGAPARLNWEYRR